MRQAVIVTPPRFLLRAEGSVFAAPEPVGPLCAALARGGRRLLLVQSTAEFARDFEQAVAHVGADDDVLVYLAASTTTRDGRVDLRVGAAGDGEPAATVALRVMSDAVAAREPCRVLFIIEACHGAPGDDPMLSAEHVDAIIRALDARARGHGVLVGVRPESQGGDGAWPFTRHVLAALADPASRDERGAARLPLVHDLLRERGTLAADVPSFALVSGRGEFAVLEPPIASHGAARIPSTPPVEAVPAAPAGPIESPSKDAGDGAAGIVIDELSSDRAAPTAVDPRRDSLRDLHSERPPDTSPEPPPITDDPSTPTLVLSAGDAQSTPDVWTAESSALPVPEPRATQPSLPAIEPLLDLADGARERGALPEALAGYKAALMIVEPSDIHTRATIYAHIGLLKRAQGKPREAELNFEKALSLDPAQPAALDALVELATSGDEVRRAIDWRRKRLVADLGPEERITELLAIADAYADKLQDRDAATAALDEASEIRPKTRSSLEKLRARHEAAQRWGQVVMLTSELAELEGDPKEKSALWFAAADLVLGRLRDEEKGLTLLDRALDCDPTNDKALHALVAVRTRRGDWEALDSAYARRVDRLAVISDAARAWDTCRKLGVLRRDKLRDVTGAIEAFTGAVRCRPDDVDSRAMLADMHLAVGDEERAVIEFEHIAALAPTRSSPYARLFALHRRAGRTDRAWLAGGALEELGTADMDQQLVVDQYRLDGPIRPSRSLHDAAWDELLSAPGADPVVSDVLRCIAPAAITTRVEELRQARQLVAIDPARRQSAASTVSAVRSFQWAAQVLGVDAPDLYVIDDVPGGIAAVPAGAPTTALGPDVLRGLTTKELAFLAARHLTYYRSEHYALVFYPTLNDLSVLFLGAVKIVLPDLPVPANLHDAVARTRKALARQLSDDERRRLAAAVERLHSRDGRVDLAQWLRGVELTAQRAGLLLCGDLAVAVARLRAEGDTRPIAELTFDDKRGDLLGFCASDRLARARALLGADAHRSVSGPPGELQAS